MTDTPTPPPTREQREQKLAALKRRLDVEAATAALTDAEARVATIEAPLAEATARVVSLDARIAAAQHAEVRALAKDRQRLAAAEDDALRGREPRGGQQRYTPFGQPVVGAEVAAARSALRQLEQEREPLIAARVELEHERERLRRQAHWARQKLETLGAPPDAAELEAQLQNAERHADRGVLAAVRTRLGLGA